MATAAQLSSRQRTANTPQGGQGSNPSRDSGGSNGDGEAPQQPTVPFVSASRERIEPFTDLNHQLQAASPTVVSNIDVPAIGFLAHVVLEVVASGGDGSTTAAVAAGDAPFNVFEQLQLADVNGNPLYGPFGGYFAYLVEKYGAYSFISDAKQKPSFADVDTNGDFAWVLRIPIQISGRDALGALANMNASQTYKVSYTVAAASQIYDTQPAPTLPSVRVRGRIEVWTQPNATSVTGQPQQQRPPMHGTTQYQALSTFNVNNGEQVVRLSRVGNIVRTIIGVLRDGSDVRTDADWPDPVRFEYDGSLIENITERVHHDRMAERYGLVHGAADAAGGLDTGVRVWEFSHDMDGHPGWEDRQLYLHTTQATRLDLAGVFGTNADQLQVVTNDIAVPA